MRLHRKAAVVRLVAVSIRSSSHCWNTAHMLFADLARFRVAQRLYREEMLKPVEKGEWQSVCRLVQSQLFKVGPLCRIVGKHFADRCNLQSCAGRLENNACR